MFSRGTVRHKFTVIFSLNSVVIVGFLIPKSVMLIKVRRTFLKLETFNMYNFTTQ